MIVGNTRGEGARQLRSRTIFISAGEASGEHYGALLVGALKRQFGGNGTNG